MRNILATMLALGTSAILIAFVLKMMHWDEAVLLMLVGIAADLIALMIYLVVRYQNWHANSTKKAAIAILILGAVLVVIGVVFRIVHWPMSNQIIFVGAGTESVALITYFSAGRKQNFN